MSRRSWGEPVAVALGMAAVVGAAQIGVGYGLGIIVWPVQQSNDQSVWLADLAWVLWLAITSTVTGAIVADRLSSQPRRSLTATAAHRAAIVVAAAVGALITVPLVAIPARSVPRPDTYAPEVTTGGYALVGVVVGLCVAISTLVSRAIATNVLATLVVQWVVAITSVVLNVDEVGDRNTALLGVWPLEPAGPGIRSALLMLATALVIGFAAAWPAARRGDSRVGMAVSGAVGPLLVAAAYFVALPGLPGGTAASSVFYMAPYAVIAGLAGSVLAASLGARNNAGAEEPQAADRISSPASLAPDLAPSTVPGPGPAKPGLPAAHDRPTTPDRPAADRGHAVGTAAVVEDGYFADSGLGTGGGQPTGVPSTADTVPSAARRSGPAAKRAAAAKRTTSTPKPAPGPVQPDEGPTQQIRSNS